jgi:hypothetical protein
LAAACALALGAATAPSAVHADAWTATARVTYYVYGQTMYDGNPVYVGAAACSWDLPLGTVVSFSDGFTAICEDRGLLGDGDPYTWVDLYGAWWAPATYGDFAVVTIVTP